MVDLTITPASVLAGSDANIVRGKAGATITAGKVVYLDAGTYKLTKTDSGTAAAKNATGIALNGASAGQPVSVVTAGTVTIGAAVTAGTAYYASETSGGIQPAADVSGEAVTFLGHATTSAAIKLAIQNTGVSV